MHHPHPISQYIFLLQSTHYCHQPKTPIGASRALKQSRFEKVMATQSRRGQNSKKQITKCNKGQSLKHLKTFLVCCFIVIRVQR